MRILMTTKTNRRLPHYPIVHAELLIYLPLSASKPTQSMVEFYTALLSGIPVKIDHKNQNQQGCRSYHNG